MAKKTTQFPVHVSRQVQPITLGGRITRSTQVRRGALTSPQMQTLGKEGVPGICKDTLIDQSLMLDWEIRSPEGKPDANTAFYTMLLQQANDGEGFDPFVTRLAEDMLTTLEGGHFEIYPNDAGIPVALYNVDSTTIFPNPDYPLESEYPWFQTVLEGEPVYFLPNWMAHSYWHATTAWGQNRRNRCPIELAYFYICVLAGSDDWNLDLVSDPMPAGVLALPGATAEEAEAFRQAWDFAIQGGQLRDLAVIYGLELKQAHHVKFTRPPTDMAFEISNHWYTSLIAASFEMSVLDISVLTNVSTKAGAESQERLSTQQGQRKLRRITRKAIERWILPEGYSFHWIIPEASSEATLAEAAERRARAANYYVMAFGPERGYEIAVQAGVLAEEGETTSRSELLRSDPGERRLKRAYQLAALSDLRGYTTLADWFTVMQTLSWGQPLRWAITTPPPDLWGLELFDWVYDQYSRELLAAIEVWMDEVVGEDPEYAIQLLQKRYLDALSRASTIAYVAGVQRDATDASEADNWALGALTLVVLGLINEMVGTNLEYFQGFLRTLREEGAEYLNRVKWRTGLYIKYLRRFFLLGVAMSANPDTDMIQIAHGSSLQPCNVCPSQWGEYTVDEYLDMQGPPPNWCEGHDNCTCRVTILRDVLQL